MRTGNVDTNRSRATNTGTLTLVDIEASGGWFAGKAWRALATEATRCIAANRSFSTTTQKALGEVAFIDILTSGGDIGRIVGPTFVANAESFFVLGFASRMSTAFYIFAWGFAGCSWRLADKTCLAFATMAAGEISADGIRSARGLGTFVDINASGAQWLEAITAETLAVQAFRIIDTIEISLADGPHIHLFARNVRCRLAGISLRAATIVTGHRVLADGLFTTRTCQHGALVNV